MSRTSSLLVGIARPMLGAAFVSGGFAGLREPGPLPKFAADAGVPLPGPTVTATSAVMLAAGTTMSVGIRPAASATVLGGCLVGITYAIHGFWRETEKGPRLAHRNAFVTNVGVLGGLALVVAAAKR